MDDQQTHPGVRRVALTYVENGYHVTRIDDRGVLLVKRDLVDPVGCLIFGWLYAIARPRSRDRRVLVTTNAEGDVIVKRMRTIGA